AGGAARPARDHGVARAARRYHVAGPGRGRTRRRRRLRPAGARAAVTRRLALAATFLAAVVPAFAQEAGPSAIALDTAVALDATVDADGNVSTGLVADAQASLALTDSLQVMVRPFLQRLGSGEWNAQVWVAGLRYERPADIGL